MSRKGGLVRSPAKTAANRLKMTSFWKKVRRGEISPPRRHRKYPEAIQAMARRYIWWLPSAESLSLPSRVIAQVMDIGTMDDCAALRDFFGVSEMRKALRRAQ